MVAGLVFGDEWEMTPAIAWTRTLVSHEENQDVFVTPGTEYRDKQEVIPLWYQNTGIGETKSSF